MQVITIAYPKVDKSENILEHITQENVDISGLDPIAQFWKGPARVRYQVFVIEQEIPAENEIDEQDAESIHVVLMDENNVPVSTARVFAYGPSCKLGRMATLKTSRGKGHGRKVVEVVEKIARETLKADQILIHAQKAQSGFYASLGFDLDTSAGEWLEEGIIHVKMSKKL